MLLILPTVAFLIFFYILRDKGLEWRAALLAAAIFCGTCVALITEMLSVPRLIYPAPVAISWLLVCVGGIFYLRQLKLRARRAVEAATSVPGPSIDARVANSSRERLDSSTKWLLGGAALVVLFVGITALVAPPDKWDAMDYHLPRMVMWMSNHTVRFYPTPDYCQLVYGSWAEYAMMHTQLLWGTDRFVNLVEFFSMLGSLIAVSLIAKKLGAGVRGQALAAVVCATIPQGLLEASGPMNTYVVSFWIATSVAFFLMWNDQPSWLYTICIGLAAGLAIFTKGTAYIFLPFVLLACWLMGTSSARVLLLKRAVPLIALILAINAPLYLRNYQFSGSPIGVPLPVKYPRLELAMPHVTVKATAANVLRNASMHLSTPSAALNSRIEKSVRFAIRAIGVDPDDPTQSWIGKRYHMNQFTSNESIAGNPLHLVLLLGSIGMILWKGKDGVRRYWAIWYALGIVASFVLFCALLQWQMWSSRFQLTLFVLGSALIGLVLEKYAPRKLATSIAVILLIPGLFLSLTNRSRSLLPWRRVDDVYHPRQILYFTDYHESIASSYLAAANSINRTGCTNVALDSYTPDPEVKSGPDSFFVYPLLALIHADGITRRVWYTGVSNLSSRYQAEQRHPAACVVVCFECAKVPEKWREYRTAATQVSTFGNVVVFTREAQLPNREPTQTTRAEK